LTEQLGREEVAAVAAGIERELIWERGSGELSCVTFLPGPTQHTGS
jgi:hypothetical protein